MLVIVVIGLIPSIFIFWWRKLPSECSPPALSLLSPIQPCPQFIHKSVNWVLTKAVTFMAQTFYLSYSFRGPSWYTSSAPPRPSRTLVAKNGSSVTCKPIIERRMSANHFRKLIQWSLIEVPVKLQMHTQQRRHLLLSREGMHLQISLLHMPTNFSCVMLVTWFFFFF